MKYDEFFAQYKDVHDLWVFGRLDPEGAQTAIERLRAVVQSVEPADKRRTAEYLLDQWANETSPEAEQRMGRALAVLAGASAEDGTPTERRARAEAGITEITRIADESTDVAERYAILGLNETLAKLIDALERAQP